MCVEEGKQASKQASWHFICHELLIIIMLLLLLLLDGELYNNILPQEDINLNPCNGL